MTKAEFTTKLTTIYAAYMNKRRAEEEADTLASGYTEKEKKTDGEKILKEIKQDICAELQCAYYLGH